MLSDDRLPAEGASLLTQPLAESWQRSQGYGLTRTDQHIPFIKAGLLEELRSRNDWVPQRVQPLIEQLGAQITRQPAIVVIADAEDDFNHQSLTKAFRVHMPAPAQLCTPYPALHHP